MKIASLFLCFSLITVQCSYGSQEDQYQKTRNVAVRVGLVAVGVLSFVAGFRIQGGNLVKEFYSGYDECARDYQSVYQRSFNQGAELCEGINFGKIANDYGTAISQLGKSNGKQVCKQYLSRNSLLKKTFRQKKCKKRR